MSPQSNSATLFNSFWSISPENFGNFNVINCVGRSGGGPTWISISPAISLICIGILLPGRSVLTLRARNSPVVVAIGARVRVSTAGGGIIVDV